MTQPDRSEVQTGDKSSGLLVVGHGTRDQAGIEEFHATCRAIAATLPLSVEGAFLEFAEPTIDAGVAQLVARGVERLVVMPLLLFAAGHAKRDIPAAVAAAASKHHGLAVRQLEHLGCHPAIVSLSRQRFSEALARTRAVAAEHTALILVGRGSRDTEATAEMHEFARLRAAQGDTCRVEIAFMSMAEPALADKLREASQWGVHRVVVQPHLLFGGVLVDRLRATVHNVVAGNPPCEWSVAEQLGPSELIVSAVIDRANATASGPASSAG